MHQLTQAEFEEFQRLKKNIQEQVKQLEPKIKIPNDGTTYTFTPLELTYYLEGLLK